MRAKFMFQLCYCQVTKTFSLAGTCTGILKGKCSALEKRGHTLIFVTATPPPPGRIFCLYHLKL